MSSILAGMMVGIGGLGFLSSDSKISGAFLFCIGLYVICMMNLNLFTGKVCYSKDGPYLLRIFFGNVFGAMLIGFITKFCKPGVVQKAVDMCQAKWLEGPALIPLAILCNFMIYFAITSYKKNNNIIFVLSILVFIICGFEHSIANVYYFTVAGMYLKGLLYIILNMAFNWFGGVIMMAMFES